MAKSDMFKALENRLYSLKGIEVRVDMPLQAANPQRQSAWVHDFQKAALSTVKGKAFGHDTMSDFGKTIAKDAQKNTIKFAKKLKKLDPVGGAAINKTAHDITSKIEIKS